VIFTIVEPVTNEDKAAVRLLLDYISSDTAWGYPAETKRVFKEIVDKYPNSALVPRALFGLTTIVGLKGEYYDSLQENEYAFQLITRYPEHPYSAEALTCVHPNLFSATQKELWQQSIAKMKRTFTGYSIKRRIERVVEKLED